MWHDGGMIQRHGPGAYYHSVVEANGTLYLSGVVAADLGADMTTQTRQVLERIDGVLAGVASDRSRIVSATIYITDMGLKDQMNDVWASWSTQGHRPARATVAVADLGPGVLIEVSAIAVR